jgi:hypothetical protein
MLYAPSNVPHVAKMLRDWSSDEKAEERERIAVTGLAEVRANHSLQARLDQIFATLKLKGTLK